MLLRWISADAAAWQAKLPALEKAAQLEKQRKEALLNIPQANQKSIDTAWLKNDEAWAEAKRGLGAASIEVAAAADVLAEKEQRENEAKEKGIANTKQFRAAMAALLPELQKAASFQETGKAFGADLRQLDAFIEKTKEHAQAIRDQSDAANTLDAQMAKENATLTPLANRIADMETEYGILKDRYGENDARVKQLAADLQILYDRLRQSAVAVGDVNTALGKRSDSEFSKELAKIRMETDAAVNGNSMMRIAAQAEEMGRRFGWSADQIAKYVDELKAKNAAEGLGSTARSVGVDIGGTRRQELEAQKAALMDLNLPAEQTALVMAKINQEEADLAAKSGGWGEGLKAGLLDFNESVGTLGEQIQKLTTKDLNDANNSIARFITTGKGGFQQLGQQITESFINMGLKRAEQALISFFLKKLALQAADRTASVANSAAGAAASKSEQRPAAATAAAKAYSAMAGIPYVGPVLGAIAAVSAFTLLSGFLAQGGDVQPGRAYVVGEKHPEVFVPGASGHVYPSSPAEFGSGRGHSITVQQSNNVNAIDEHGMHELLQEHGRAIAEEVQRQLRNGNMI